jgi:hypothetical protein
MSSVPSSHYSTSKSILGDAFPKSGMASNLIAMRVEAEDKTSRRNDVCPVVYDDERFITREDNAERC